MATRLSDCIIVVIKSSLRGGVEYRHSKEVLEERGEGEYSKWETEKVIANKRERQDATNLCQRLRRSFNAYGVKTDVGLAVPARLAAEIRAQHQTNRQEAEAHNSRAQHTRVGYACLQVVIAPGDEASQYVLDTIKDGLQVLRDSLRQGNVDEARTALREIKGVEDVLASEHHGAASDALAEVRKAYRDMAKGAEEEKAAYSEARAHVVDRLTEAVFGQVDGVLENDPEVEIEVSRVRASVLEDLEPEAEAGDDVAPLGDGLRHGAELGGEEWDATGDDLAADVR